MGAAWGHLAGCTIGVERAARLGAARAWAAGELWQPPATPGSWGAGGALTLALLDSLLAAGFDPADQARRAWDWYYGSAYTVRGDERADLDPRTHEAIHAFEHGTTAEACGPTGSAPGDDAMAVVRSVAVALAGRSVDDASLADRAIRSARVVDGRESARVASAGAALILRRLLAGHSDDELDRVLEAVLARLDAILAARGEGERAGRALRDGGGLRRAEAPIEAFRAAWAAFSGAASFPDAVDRGAAATRPEAVVPLAGAFAGARFGVEGIPAPLLIGLRGRHVAAPIVGRLLASPDHDGGGDMPIAIDWVDPVAAGLTDIDGRLGTARLPGIGLSGEAIRWAILEQAAAYLAADVGADAVALLALDHEFEPLRTARYTAALAAHHFDLLRATLADDDVPPDPAAFRRVVGDVLARLRQGRTVVLACRTGRGRSALALGCLLREAGVGPDAVLAFLAETRLGAIRSPAVEAFIRDWH
jgi:ADP-ribosylglycohydrolase/protein-tyrosine phosphatase